TNRPLIEIPLPQITSIEEKIGSYIVDLVPDRANLQLGIGGIPDAALTFLHEKQDLGIHTEMFSDGVVDLYEEGIITNKFNNLHPNKFTATFLMGTKRLYDFVDHNPDVEMHPVDYTNNVLIAGKVNNLISINSALQVDLFGQVSADTLGTQQYSGVGGQVDFVRASSLSPGGKSIIALPSTNKSETISRIVPQLNEGACVTTSRNDIHYVVTEYGVANLRGKTVRQRAIALINIAHPKFREEIQQKFMDLVFK
ncbi:MAG: acetyl-CoA hydrolase/transferase family protein, partial [Candidatus Thorarchaeota archaeon]